MPVPIFKFIRFNVTGCTGGVWQTPILNKISFFENNSWINPIPTAGIIATASGNIINNTPNFSLDASTLSKWQANHNINTGASWIQFEFPKAIELGSYTLYFHYWTSQAWSDWTVSGSNDGITWTLISSESGITKYTSYVYEKYLGVLSLSRSMGSMYDVASLTPFDVILPINFDSNAPSIISSKSLNILFDSLGSTNIDNSLNINYDVIAPVIKSSRIIQSWDILASSQSLVRHLGINYDIAPPTASASAFLPALTGSFYADIRSSFRLPRITSSASIETASTASASAILPALRSNSYSGVLMHGILPNLTSSSQIISGVVINSSVSLPAFKSSVLYSSNGYASSSAMLPSLKSTALILSGNTSLISGLIPKPYISSTMISGSFATLSTQLPAVISNSVMMTDGTITASSFLPMFRSGILGRNLDGTGVFSGWAVNLENNATSEYRGWEFNSIVNFGGIELASSANGIHKLSGDMDGIYNIDAEGLSSQTDFETSSMKRIRDAHIGMRNNGPIYIRTVTDENIVRDYTSNRFRDGLHEQRIKLGRGVKSRYWQIGFGNINGSYFEIDSIEILPDVLSRRVR